MPRSDWRAESPGRDAAAVRHRAPPAGFDAVAAAGPARSLSGRRILIAEDEFFVAILVEQILKALGCVCLGPVASVEEVVPALRMNDVDAAVLDINLAGQRIYPAADEMVRR